MDTHLKDSTQNLAESVAVDTHLEHPIQDLRGSVTVEHHDSNALSRSSSPAPPIEHELANRYYEGLIAKLWDVVAVSEEHL